MGSFISRYLWSSGKNSWYSLSEWCGHFKSTEKSLDPALIVTTIHPSAHGNKILQIIVYFFFKSDISKPNSSFKIVKGCAGRQGFDFWQEKGYFCHISNRKHQKSYLHSLQGKILNLRA